MRNSEYAIHIDLPYNEFCALDNELFDNVREIQTCQSEAQAMTYCYLSDNSCIGFDDNPHSKRIIVFPSDDNRKMIVFWCMPQ